MRIAYISRTRDRRSFGRAEGLPAAHRQPCSTGEIVMTKTRTLEMFTQLTGAVLLFGFAMPALATPPCSVRSIAGAWMFATDLGQQKIFPGGDITAIGTMNIDSNGNLSGKFDATVAEFRFLPNIPYSGSVTVNSDCTGTLTFVTGAGTMRTDSIVVLSRSEMWGMSQDPLNLWTYKVRRISKVPGQDALSAKIDAIMQRIGLAPEAFGGQ
jgi:hypothetical protein